MAEIERGDILASSVAVKFHETHGRPFVTASRTEYLPFPKESYAHLRGKTISKSGVRLCEQESED